MVRRGRFFLFFVVLVIVAILGGGFFWWFLTGQPVSKELGEGTQQIFVVKKGESVGSIGRRLEEAGLIRSAFAFKLRVLVKDLSQGIQAGSFRLSSTLELEEIVDELGHGTLDLWVTFPEGWRSEQMAQRLMEVGFDIDLDEWVLEVDRLNLEGYLFPDTYLIPRGASAKTIIGILKDNFDKKTEGVFDHSLSVFNVPQMVTLASLVEREVKTDKDRPIVAGIIIKRWKNGWPLQIDATVQYLVADRDLVLIGSGRVLTQIVWWKPNLTKQDLEIDSPYNTYKYQGIPPGPICNPGLGSIKAVVDFQESPYWFYISDLAGGIHYAETIEEHNANIAKYLGK